MAGELNVFKYLPNILSVYTAEALRGKSRAEIPDMSQAKIPDTLQLLTSILSLLSLPVTPDGTPID